MNNPSEFKKLFKIAKNNYSEIIMKKFVSVASIKEQKFIESLALQTQIVIKKSEPNFNHGFLIYFAIAKYILNNPKIENLFMLDIGTARGFSSIVAARVIKKFKKNGLVVSIDIIPHNKKIKWKCILDNSFGISRNEIVERFQESEIILFLEGKSKNLLNRLATTRINFAFIDGEHKWKSLKTEIEYTN